jgi:hypothetical protein
MVSTLYPTTDFSPVLMKGRTFCLKITSDFDVIRDEDIGITDIAVFYNDASFSLIVPKLLIVTEITAISDAISVQPDALAVVPQFITNCMN